jgi:hypothetical protein
MNIHIYIYPYLYIQFHSQEVQFALYSNTTEYETLAQRAYKTAYTSIYKEIKKPKPRTQMIKRSFMRSHKAYKFPALRKPRSTSIY